MSNLDKLKSLTNFEEAVDLSKEDKSQVTRFDSDGAKEFLKGRILGQDHVIDDLCEEIRLGFGKRKRMTPVYVAFFAGPPATGKSALSEALAEFLYGDGGLVQIDGGQLGQMGKSSLVGSSVGYAGSDKPGQLTGPLLINNKRVVLFDEIEKAQSDVFDILLPALSAGKLREESCDQKTADLTQTIVLFTSNLAANELVDLQRTIDSPEELQTKAREVILRSKVFRPELISRFSKIYIFKPLESEEIRVQLTLLHLMETGKAYGVEIEWIHPSVVADITRRGKGKDVREIKRIIDSKLASPLMAADEHGLKQVRISVDDDSGELIVEPGSAG